MANNRLANLFSVAVLACCTTAATAKTIEGQIFIVTRGAQAIKLPLVTVAAIPAAEMQQHIAEVEAKIAPECSKADAAASEADSALRKAERSVSGGFGKWMMKLRNTKATDPTGQSWSDPGTESHRFNSIQGRIPGLEARASEAQSRKSKLHSAAPFFEALPAVAASAKTDADGRFKLTLPDEGDFVLVAASSRDVAERTEKYFWVVRLKPDDTAVTLSNDNLAGSESADSMVR